MVFKRPNPLPLPISISIYENVVFGIRSHSTRMELKKDAMDQAVEETLIEMGLWPAVKDKRKATGLTLGQQQKLCTVPTATTEASDHFDG